VSPQFKPPLMCRLMSVVLEQYPCIIVPRDMNERSDFNSHLNDYDHYDFSLKIGFFQYVESCFGPHSVDRFASAMSTQLLCFNTKYCSPLAEAIDAFSLDWGNYENNYVFPPPALVGQAIRHAQRCRAVITLVFMEWYTCSQHVLLKHHCQIRQRHLPRLIIGVQP
jgi:hypothetical protein